MKNLPIGHRVKLTKRAFENGVYDDTEANRALRGAIARHTRRPDRVAVLWDGRKTIEVMWEAFVNQAVAPHSNAAKAR